MSGALPVAAEHYRNFRYLVVALLVGFLGGPPAWAGGSSRNFSVDIVLQNGQGGLGQNGICVNESLSESANAIVRVACSTGQFVDISPIPGHPFAGTHGGAFRFNFGPGHWIESALAGTADTLLGMGTVTAMRIYRADEENVPLELLVSF